MRRATYRTGHRTDCRPGADHRLVSAPLTFTLRREWDRHPSRLDRADARDRDAADALRLGTRRGVDLHAAGIDERSSALTPTGMAEGRLPSGTRLDETGNESKGPSAMIFEQFYLDCLSQASYLIGDETTGKAVVVDPRRDIDI